MLVGTWSSSTCLNWLHTSGCLRWSRPRGGPDSVILPCSFVPLVLKVSSPLNQIVLIFFFYIGRKGEEGKLCERSYFLPDNQPTKPPSPSYTETSSMRRGFDETDSCTQPLQVNLLCMALSGRCGSRVAEVSGRSIDRRRLMPDLGLGKRPAGGDWESWTRENSWTEKWWWWRWLFWGGETWLTEKEMP